MVGGKRKTLSMWAALCEACCMLLDTVSVLASASQAQVTAYFESGGTVKPEPLTTTSSAPLRVLCLHGGGSNKAVMTYQTRELCRLFGAGASFDYLEGPRPFAVAEVDPQVRQLFGEGPYHCWYGVYNDGSPQQNFLERLRDHSVNFTYSDVETAIATLEAALVERGPFDVLLGFSQGAIIISILTALRLKAARESGAPPPEWRMNVLVCGMPPRDNRYIELTTTPPMEFPCIQVFGQRDPFYSYGQVPLPLLGPSSTLCRHAPRSYPSA
jgi:predicted esterase